MLLHPFPFCLKSQSFLQGPGTKDSAAQITLWVHITFSNKGDHPAAHPLEEFAFSSRNTLDATKPWEGFTTFPPLCTFMQHHCHRYSSHGHPLPLQLTPHLLGIICTIRSLGSHNLVPSLSTLHGCQFTTGNYFGMNQPVPSRKKPRYSSGDNSWQGALLIVMMGWTRVW